MKKGTAIIAEFNPFHNGHRYIIEKASEAADFVGIIMSGSFVQRGEPAVFDKFLRTRAALLNGADIVLELPVVYATGGADVFAYGGLDTVRRSGIFDSLTFGCECEDTSALEGISDILFNEPAEFKEIFRKYTDMGLSYPKAREKALCHIYGIKEGILSKPNNILGIEYMRAIRTLGADIEPRSIERIGCGYNEESLRGEYSSATAIRKALFSEQYDSIREAVPANLFNMYTDEIRKGVPNIEDYKDILKYIILSKGAEGLKYICDVTEGLENKIYSNSDFESIEELLNSIKSKRYTMTKLKRALLHILLDIKREDAYPPKPVPYIRVLGVRKEKRDLLSHLGESAEVPVIINVKKDIEALSEEGQRLLNKEIFATNIYNMKTKGRDYTQGIIIV